MMARRALLLLDGLDEGGQERKEIEVHVSKVLAPQGHVMLCTSRPAGVTEELFIDFRHLKLSPLTDAQQEQALTQRLGPDRVAKLMPYVHNTVPRDVETGLLVTSNPLMLSMVASVYELRGDLQMPRTIAELYEVSSDAMLAQGRASSIIYASCCSASSSGRIAQQRVIEDRHHEAALGMERPEALEAIRAGTDPFRYQGRAEKGHYVGVLVGDQAGKCGIISTDDGSSNPYKVTFENGKKSSWLSPTSSGHRGNGRDAFDVHAREPAASNAQVQRECLQLTPSCARRWQRCVIV